MSPKNKNRDYAAENAWQSSKEQVERRMARNRARAKAEREGKVSKGDGKEVHHVGAKRTGALDNSKVRVVSKAANRAIQPKRGKKK